MALWDSVFLQKKRFLVWILIIHIEGLHDAVRSHTPHDFALPLVSYFYSAVWRKTTNTLLFEVRFIIKFQILLKCVLTFLSLGCSLVLWYNLNQKFLDILLCFPCKTMGSGNQHGDRECDDLQNWPHMTSHENPLLWNPLFNPRL